MRNVFRVIIRRRLKRFVTLFVTVLCISAVITLLVFFDVTCVSQHYEPVIQLRNISHTFDTQRSTVPLPQWSPLIDQIVSIYSAYYYSNKFVVIALIEKSYVSHKFACRLRRNARDEEYEIIDAKIEELSENWSNYYNYISVKVICQKTLLALDTQRVNQFEINVFVPKLSAKYNRFTTTFIPVLPLSTDPLDISDKQMIVCVRPLYGPFSSVASILEFIAYYRANSVDRVVFYELDVSPKVLALLRSMSPFVQLLSFGLPIDAEDIHAEGQIAAMNDCVLRSAPNSVILVDIDELIIVKRHNNLKQFIADKTSSDTNIGALVIPNVMICDQYSDITDSEISFPRILSATVRQTTKWEHRDRSKLIIVQPLSLHRLGIHTVWSWNDQRLVNHNVDESEAMLFHYRSCCMVWQPFYRNRLLGITLYFRAYYDTVVTDTSVSKFKPDILLFLRTYAEF